MPTIAGTIPFSAHDRRHCAVPHTYRWTNQNKNEDNFGAPAPWPGSGGPVYKRPILSHHKELNCGDYLIDDRPNSGATEFEGEWIEFGEARFDGFENKEDFWGGRQSRTQAHKLTACCRR